MISDDSRGLLRQGIGQAWIGKIVEEGQPQTCTSSRRTTSGRNLGLVEIPGERAIGVSPFTGGTKPPAVK